MSQDLSRRGSGLKFHMLAMRLLCACSRVRCQATSVLSH